MSMKNFSDTIGNRTRDLLVCSAVPQPTAPPLIPIVTNTKHITFVQGTIPHEFLFSSILNATPLMQESCVSKLQHCLSGVKFYGF